MLTNHACFAEEFMQWQGRGISELCKLDGTAHMIPFSIWRLQLFVPLKVSSIKTVHCCFTAQIHVRILLCMTLFNLIRQTHLLYQLHCNYTIFLKKNA